MMSRLIQALGAGLIGSLIFFVANLFFGGDSNSAYQASFWGFWVFAVAGFLIGGGKKE